MNTTLVGSTSSKTGCICFAFGDVVGKKAPKSSNQPLITTLNLTLFGLYLARSRLRIGDKQWLRCQNLTVDRTIAKQPEYWRAELTLISRARPIKWSSFGSDPDILKIFSSSTHLTRHTKAPAALQLFSRRARRAFDLFRGGANAVEIALAVW